MEGEFVKIGNTLVPTSEDGSDLLQKIKSGHPVMVTFRRPRNYKYHKKFFALLNHAYDCWTPSDVEMPQYLTLAGHTPEKNFKRFRNDLTILAGYYDTYIRLNGDVRLEAKSISFAAMTEDEFDDLYSKTIDAILKHVLKQYTKEDLDTVVEEIMGYV